MLWQVKPQVLVNQLPEFKSHLYHVRVVWSSISYLTLICKVEIIILLSYMVVVRIK